MASTPCHFAIKQIGFANCWLKSLSDGASIHIDLRIRTFILPLPSFDTCSGIGHREPIVTGLLIGAKKCREARGSYFV